MTRATGTTFPDFIVGIGGSAGGLVAYKAFFDSMPSNSGMAFVIVSHILPTAHSQLAEILSKHTTMPVSMISKEMQIEANHVYALPPNADLHIESGAFKVASPRGRGNEQVDVFFISLAKAMGARAIGVVLSGYDGDGTAGCSHIKAQGGTTFAQDDSAEVNGMPLNAQAAGCIDFVLPPEGIARKLGEIGARFLKENVAKDST